MRVDTSTEGSMPDTTLSQWQFPSDDSKSEVLFYCINSTFDRNIQKKYEHFKRKVLLNIWTPCEFTCPPNEAGNAFHQTDFFTEVYSICPYTVKWMNQQQNTNKYKFIFLPIETSYIPTTFKEYDVCYLGGLHGDIHKDCINKIKEFNYQHLSTQERDIPTDYYLPYHRMLDKVGKAKISICYNTVPLNDNLVSWIKTYKNWGDNEAFKYITEGYMPQFKVRMHEAALCKTLNLVQRDKWNVVENFYLPEKDFIYFEDNKELPDLIKKILINYEDYKDMIENAYNKCLYYSPSDAYKLITKGSHWKERYEL